MLAYIFWHRPYPQTEQKSYEAAIARFQHDLAGQPPPGFIAAASFWIEPVPWLDDHPGYEDWCLLDGSWALDPLNGFAVTGPRQPSHDAEGGMQRVQVIHPQAGAAGRRPRIDRDREKLQRDPPAIEDHPSVVLEALCEP